MAEQSHERGLYVCRNCGYVDFICAAEGFWEKGVDDEDNDIFECDACGKRGQIDPLPDGVNRKRGEFLKRV